MLKEFLATMASFLIVFVVIAAVVVYRYMHPQATLPTTCADICDDPRAPSKGILHASIYVTRTGKRIQRKRTIGGV